MSSTDTTSSSVPYSNQANLTAPTPANTPLNPAPIASRLSRPTVADIPEDGDEDDEVDAPELLNSLDGPSKQAINALMQHKLANLIGRSSGYIESLPVPTKRRVEGLKGLSVQYDDLLKVHKKELYELERKFLKDLVPLNKKRAEIIAGKAEPTAAEVEAGQKVSLEDDPESEPLPAPSASDSSVAAGIPEFWLTALKNHIAFNELITERDEPALRHLVDITLEYLTGQVAGYKILFHFSKNEFFTDEVLVKEYRYKDELDVEGDYLYERAVGQSIAWKEDKDLTHEIETRRQRNKATNRTRVVRRSKPTESFFNFFAPPEPLDEDAEDEMEEEELAELSENLEMDFQLGQDLKERVVPRAIDYFTGKALQWEDDEDEDDEDFEDYSDEDDDDEEDEDEDEDDDDDEVPPVRRRGKGGKGGAAGAENVDPQECKNQ